MKIIRKGNDNTNHEYSFICKSCNCWFEVTKQELQCYYFSRDFKTSYPCPNCGELTEGINKQYLEVLNQLHGVTLDE